MRPNFLYIGTGKAGSTWVFEALRRHPKVFVTGVKETNFFDLNFHRGTDWYERFFQEARQPAVGEVGHRYLRHPEAAQRIHEVLGPSVRLLVCLRRPEDFVLSAYQFSRRNGRFRGGVEAWMEQRFMPESVCYASLLRPFMERFGRQQLHITCFDDIEQDPDRAFSEICQFLGVTPPPKAIAALRHRVNSAAEPRAASVALSVNILSKYFRRSGHPRLVAWVKHRRLLRHLLYRPLPDQVRPQLSDRVRQNLRRIAEPEVLALDRALGTQLHARWYAETQTPLLVGGCSAECPCADSA